MTENTVIRDNNGYKHRDYLVRTQRVCDKRLSILMIILSEIKEQN